MTSGPRGAPPDAAAAADGADAEAAAAARAAHGDIVACIAFRRDIPDPGHDLLRAFRAGDPGAFARVVAALDVVLDGLRDLAPPGTLAVAVPGHGAGAKNAPCLALIAAVGPARGWVREEPGLLRRIADAPEAKRFGPRDPAAEAGTLAWDPAAIVDEAPRILLVDDVVASGATLRAALAALPPAWRPRARLLACFRSMTG